MILLDQRREEEIIREGVQGGWTECLVNFSAYTGYTIQLDL